MYFEIENTPEHIKKARRPEFVQKESPKEECPRLILAPFSRPPQVVFENVVIGSCCERNLEVFNPSKQVQQITLGRALPPGLVIHLPGEWLVLEPETCYCLSMVWSPNTPTAMRETIRFTNENRGRYDVIIVLKSIMNIKGRSNQPKGFKISPGKINKKVTKKSPSTIHKKKAAFIYNTTHIKKTVIQSTQHKVFQSSNKENVSTYNDYSINSYTEKCPFDSPTSIDFNFDTSEVFSNMRTTKSDAVLQQTYDKSFNANNRFDSPQNVLKPSNKQTCVPPACDIFDNLTFTPLKSLPKKNDKLDKGPKIILSVNSESDFDDSLDLKNSNKENQTHSIICVTSAPPPNKWLSMNHHYTQVDSQSVATPTKPSKKHPDTSSPIELNSPNFSINTDFSRISDLSFFPPRFSTERKGWPKMNNETHEIIDDIHLNKLSSDTYTKDSPNTPAELHPYEMYIGTKLMKEQPKMCRQALFTSKHYLAPYEHNVWHNDPRVDGKSPPRSLTPPLQSIPEESVQLSDTQVLDKSERPMTTFTIDRTFERDRTSISSTQTWSKKAIRAEPELWKVPTSHAKKSIKPKTITKNKESLSGKMSNATFEFNKSINQNISVNQIGNVYSQSFTVDPFLSSTYFYDEEAVEKFEKEFKRWLNCILTPPAELESNVEQKIDVGKAWIENRNKDVPVAPTKEQVSSAYHNSHRLASLRRSAKALLMSAEMAQVFLKLNAQVDKKLITIRADRNLHLDVGLQKIIMELLLSYNPLWLRIGLEAIYGLVLPLKSNSDIEGLTTFIIQRMFKNPRLKNKQSKSNVPNMLLPAYMDAIKKFTLKKFFMLVFFLDQAKQRKLISHDPCLFCRNATCKESREIIIRFTRELIAGIGDITKHLRPLGYVVSHKQSYLDEYKYAVHNIALDLRDGVRLTKVMEIILIKNGLLNQLRTPPISRLQKIHNVQVALNALKEANFTIFGDINSNDIADGHREKTLSLLWQLIHVFRAPLFEKAANVIQTWWRKKYDVIIEKRKEEEKIMRQKITAACVIQCWWRRIQYNRLVEWQMTRITTATVVIQKYFRMWFCRSRLRKLKKSVMMIEEWFISVKKTREAKNTLNKLRKEREELKCKSATILQSYVKRWICMKQFKLQVKKVILIQSVIRRFLVQKQYSQLLKYVIIVQQKYRGKLLMKLEMHKLAEKRKCAILIQSYYKMTKQRMQFNKHKDSVRTIEERYLALIRMRQERKKYLELKHSVILLQAQYRGCKCREEYTRKKNALLLLQRKIRAHQLMKKEKGSFKRIKSAVTVLQRYIRSYLLMRQVRLRFVAQRKSAVCIQRYFRAYLLTKSHRNFFIRLRNATIVLQNSYRNVLQMRQDRSSFLKIKNAALTIQRRFRANIAMKTCKAVYLNQRKAIVTIQNRYRAQKKMREERSKYLEIKSACLTIQNSYKAYVLGKKQRQIFLRNKEAAIVIQNWYTNCKKTKQVKQEYNETKHACVTIQRIYRAYTIGRKERQQYIRIKTATICIQKYYRSYLEMKIVRQEFVQLKTATVTIQRHFRSHVESKIQRKTYLQFKAAALVIGNYYRCYKETQIVRKEYCELRKATLCIQRRYKSLCATRLQRQQFLIIKQYVVKIQRMYRALLAMRKDRKGYLALRTSTIIIQTKYKAQCLMKQERNKYLLTLKAIISIQRFYRAYVTGKKQRLEYLKLKQSTVALQRRYKALLEMRRDKSSYLAMRTATLAIQRRYRARLLMLQDKLSYTKILKACISIQRVYRAYLVGRRQRQEYVHLKSIVITIQTRFRSIVETRKLNKQYQQLRNAAIFIQRRFRAKKIARCVRQNEAARRIQTWYKTMKTSQACRYQFLMMKQSAVVIQSVYRMFILRRRFLILKRATLVIQRTYRSYKLGLKERQNYLKVRTSITKIQSHIRTYILRKHYLRIRSAVLTIQAAYRFKKQMDLNKARRERAAVVLQKNIRRYIVHSRYQEYRSRVIFVQKIWRGKLVTRLMRCEFLQKKHFMTKLQSIIRGYLVRRKVENEKENLLKIKEEKRRQWGASKIQALFRGNKARTNIEQDKRVVELRRRWREGALESKQESLKERNEEAIDVLRNMADIETVIRAFRSLELLTEVFPMMYNNNASSIVRRVYVYMLVTNRSISSIEVLKSAASVLVNLTRYRITGPKIYARDRISPILKFMWRFSNSETQLFCIMCTYLWLFSKYDEVREDLTNYLHLPENHKMLATIKGNVDRMKRMTTNAIRNKYHTPQPSKFKSHTNHSLNHSVCSSLGNNSILLPALEPDYGITRADKPRYFEDAKQAINCLYQTYKL